LLFPPSIAGEAVAAAMTLIAPADALLIDLRQCLGGDPGGGEELAYDLQQLGRATVVGERTRGGAHPIERFRIRPHLQATIPIARSPSPVSGGNWEGTGVLPDVPVAAGEALDAACQRARSVVPSR
jgi:hypothetical protein